MRAEGVAAAGALQPPTGSSFPMRVIGRSPADEHRAVKRCQATAAAASAAGVAGGPPAGGG